MTQRRALAIVRGYPGTAILDAPGTAPRDRVEHGSRDLVTDSGPSRLVLAPRRAG